jgi:hypothetical protein
MIDEPIKYKLCATKDPLIAFKAIGNFRFSRTCCNDTVPTLELGKQNKEVGILSELTLELGLALIAALIIELIRRISRNVVKL